MSEPSEGTALYFADGRAFGAAHAAPAMSDAPEVGRSIDGPRTLPIPDPLSSDDLLALCARVKVSRQVEGVEAHQIAEAVEVLHGDLATRDAEIARLQRELADPYLDRLRSDLAHEREAHRLTVLGLTAAREEAGVTLRAAKAEIDRLMAVAVERDDVFADYKAIAKLSLSRQATEITDLKQRLLGMTAHAVDRERDTNAALAREGVALARLRKAEGIMRPALEHLAETVTGRPLDEVAVEIERQVAEHPDPPPRLILADAGAELVLDRMEHPRAPTEATKALFTGPYEGLDAPPVFVQPPITDDDDTEVVDDPDAIERVSPEVIAVALGLARQDLSHRGPQLQLLGIEMAESRFVALADLVVDWLDAGKAVAAAKSAYEREPAAMPIRPALHRRYLDALRRQDTIERVLARAVKS